MNHMTLFSKIIKGDIPSYKILENERFYSFLDINPLREGHTLVIPKIEIDQFFDLPDNLLQEILIFAKPIAKAIEKTISCNRCGISIVGLEIPHAHLHLIPIDSADDLNFMRKKLSFSPSEFEATRVKIISNFSAT